MPVTSVSPLCISNQRWNSHAEGGRDDILNQQVEGQSGQVILLTDAEDERLTPKLEMFPEPDLNLDLSFDLTSCLSSYVDKSSCDSTSVVYRSIPVVSHITTRES